MSINGNRWSKFWWQDWRSDPALRACSLTARGLWMELLCMAHEGTPYGHVTLGGRAPTNEQLSSIVGVSARKIEKLIAELESAGVFSRDEKGVMYCRRMVRDFATSEEGRQHISKRWGQNGPPPPNSPPTSEPNSGPSRRPNGVAISPPTWDPSSLEAEAESDTDSKGERADSLPSASAVAPARPRPEDWQLSIPMIAFGVSLGLFEPDIAAAADKMRDWVRSGHRISGCWDARFRNWLREDVERRRSQRRGWDQNPVGTLQQEWELQSHAMGHYDPAEFSAAIRRVNGETLQ